MTGRVSPELAHTLEVVFPVADVQPNPGVAGGADLYRAVPHVRQARILVPGRDRRAATAAVRGYGRLQPRGKRLLRRVLAPVLARSPRLWDPAIVSAGQDTLRGHLEGLLQTELRLAVPVRRLDPHSKPTVQVLRPDGRTVAFCKVGLGPAADRLRCEAAGLRRFAAISSPGLRTPRLLNEGPWLDRYLVVTTPVPVDARRATPRQWSRTCRALSALRLDSAAAPLAATTWAATAADRLLRSERSAGTDVHRALHDTLALVLQRHGRTEMVPALSHGDWTPWNLALRGDEVWCWDFEHSEASAPQGLDIVHGLVQIGLRLHGLPIDRAAERATRTAEHVLEHTLGVRGAVGSAVVSLGLWDADLRACEVRDATAPRRWGRQEGVTPDGLLRVLDQVRVRALGSGT